MNSNASTLESSFVSSEKGSASARVALVLKPEVDDNIGVMDDRR